MSASVNSLVDEKTDLGLHREIISRLSLTEKDGWESGTEKKPIFLKTAFRVAKWMKNFILKLNCRFQRAGNFSSNFGSTKPRSKTEVFGISSITYCF